MVIKRHKKRLRFEGIASGGWNRDKTAWAESVQANVQRTFLLSWVVTPIAGQKPGRRANRQSPPAVPPYVPLQINPHIKIHSGENITLMHAHQAKPRFTVVDDDSHVLFFVERALRDAFPQSEIKVFHDGREALDHVRKGQTDVLITDHCMAHMSGAQLIKTLRNDGFTLPIVMISNSPHAEEEGTAAGATAYFEKDAAMKGLPEIIRALQKVSCA
jgi:CheY-like chemotaxis protein